MAQPALISLLLLAQPIRLKLNAQLEMTEFAFGTLQQQLQHANSSLIAICLLPKPLASHMPRFANGPIIPALLKLAQALELPLVPACSP